MRQLYDHKVSGLNEAIQIEVIDKPGQAGACHEYLISFLPKTATETNNAWRINFQNGPVKEFGYNGLTQESLLAVVIDRLRSFQVGPFSCRDNDIALTHLEDALMWLQKRTRDRMARGIEGMNIK